MRISRRDKAEMMAIVDKLESALKGHGQIPAIMVLSRLMPSLFCELPDYKTITETIDGWRMLNEDMERWIRIHFGEIHYSCRRKNREGK